MEWSCCSHLKALAVGVSPAIAVASKARHLILTAPLRHLVVIQGGSGPVLRRHRRAWSLLLSAGACL